MKRIFIALILIIIIFLLSGCGDSFEIPRVELIKNEWSFDTTYLPLRDNHKFAEVPYGIEETENGYNIIIYCVEEKENELQ